MADEARSRLGRGLASLIGDVGDESAKVERPRAQRRVPIEFLKPSARNPRRDFKDADLNELTASVRERGIIQPIIVRPVKGTKDSYEIIAGERRWRAAQKAGLHEVPIVPLDVTDNEALEIAIIENVQRADLNPIEEARGYMALADEFKRSQDEIAKIVGKSRSHVSNMMRLTRLPESVQAFLVSGQLSAGHARALLNVDDPETVAKQIVAENLSVRQTESLAHEKGVPTRQVSKPRAAKSKDADTVALEKRLSDALGLSVTVDHKNPGGAVHIRYRDLEQLDEILRRLEKGA